MEVTHFESSINIDNHNCEIYFLRHAESLANLGNILIDSPLSENGIKQSKQVEGHFDVIFCSPLRRTLETLHYSRLTYDNLVIEHDIREMVQDISSCLLLEQREKFLPETLDSFWKRANRFTQTLEKKSEESNKILIISHGFFFNAWYRRGCYTTPENGKIIRLL